jgi:hypothetical protein
MALWSRFQLSIIAMPQLSPTSTRPSAPRELPVRRRVIRQLAVRLLPPQPHCPTLSRVSTRRLCLPSPSSSTLCARFRRSVPHICPCVLNLSLALWSRRAIYIDLVQTSAYASRIPTNCGAAYCFPTQLADISENLIYMNQWKRL